MKRYVSIVNASTSSIYGDYRFAIGMEVPEIYAMKFPHYVHCIEEEDEVVEEVIEEPTKKQRRFNDG